MLALVTTSPRLAGLHGAFVEPDQWEELSHCPICQQSTHLRDVGIVERGTIASVCLDCEYGFLRKRPIRDWYERFYSSEWDQHGQSKVGGSTKVIKPKRNPRAFNFCSDHLPPKSSVIDVGAGFGKILLAFRDKGHNVFGIERSEHRARYVQDVLSIPCSRSPVESFKPSTAINLVCMNHVLEHVSDPAEVMSIIASMLQEGGMFYVAVPDFWRGEYPPQTFHFVPHVSSFTVKSLTRLFVRQGFRVLKTSAEKDIQILAVKEKTSAVAVPEDSDDASRSDFWQRTSTAVLQAFGARPGHHTLVWFEDDSQQTWLYQRQVFSGPRLISVLLKMAIASETAIERVLPAKLRDRVRRALPAFLISGKTRMLSVDLSGDMTLAVHIKHPQSQAPVWIK